MVLTTWADFCVYPTPIRLQSELKISFLICSARLLQRIVVYCIKACAGLWTWCAWFTWCTPCTCCTWFTRCTWCNWFTWCKRCTTALGVQYLVYTGKIAHKEKNVCMASCTLYMVYNIKTPIHVKPMQLQFQFWVLRSQMALLEQLSLWGVFHWRQERCHDKCSLIPSRNIEIQESKIKRQEGCGGSNHIVW